MVDKHADSLDSFMLERNDGLQMDGRGAGSHGVAVYVPEIRPRGSGQASGACGQVREGAGRPQERAPDYRVVAAWSAFLIFIGAGAFVLGMAIHNEATAKAPAPPPEPIYYCATGVEMPAFERCRDRKDQRNI
jgi:hypothetical protein